MPVLTEADAHLIEWMFLMHSAAEDTAAEFAFTLQKRIGERAYWARVDPSALHRDNDTIPLPKGDSEEDRLTVRMWALRDKLEAVTRRLRELQAERRGMR